MFGRKSKFLSRVENPARGYDSFDLKLGDEMRGERATLGKSLMDVQRELRIKASYIAAIENTDLSAFDSLSFVAGYVRSYARYLEMDPEIVFARFCEESGFGGATTLKPMESEVSRRTALGPDLAAPGPGFAIKAKRKPQRPVDPLMGAGNPFANKATPVFAGFEPGALGSLAVLALLIGGIGYGGWTVVQEIQRVQVAPVEQAPELVAELDPLVPSAPQLAAPDGAGIEAPAQDALARLYRPQALDAPILTARDAPISTITPGTVGALASAEPAGLAGPDAALADGTQIASAVDAVLEEALGDDLPATPRVLADAPDAVVLVAAREAWVRVRSAEGDTLFEKVLAPGETYEIPAGEAPASLRTGNSGAVYLSVAGQTYGPLAPGPQVVTREVSAALVSQDYALADMEQDGDLARVVAELEAAPVLPGSEPAPTE
ncbi:helix-turn-helix domain-containing protein [Jannaschia sp. KMU-145]|uniref:helix-turn-helix domain-containing protein n=1 Tax=Jannaschia halovivens TaxID=3388667 RepID=UPI00396B2DA6